MRTVRKTTRRMFRSAKQANRRWKKLTQTLRDTGVAPRIYKTTDAFSLNRVGASTIYDASLVPPPSPLVEQKGGFQAHCLREMFPEWAFRYAHNLGWRSVDLSSSLAYKPVDQKTVLKRFTRRFHGKNNFSQPCELRIYLLYPKHDMDAGDIKKFMNVASPPSIDHNSYLRLLCPTISTSGSDYMPDTWPANQTYTDAGQYGNVLAQRAFLYEWEPKGDPTFQEIFRIKKIRHRRLEPGDEIRWSYTLKNQVQTKRMWGIPIALTSNDPELPIWRRGYPLMLISVRGTMVHAESEVSSMMSNVSLKPTYGDFNFDIIERTMISAVNGPAVTAQQSKAVGFMEPIHKDSTIIGGDLDAWADQQPSEQKGEA